MGDEVTIPAIVNNATGLPNQTQNGYTVECAEDQHDCGYPGDVHQSFGRAKWNETRTPCGKLFNLTQNNSPTRPSDTLQAAVKMALNPLSKVTQLYNTVTGQAPFAGLSGAPNDWTIGVAYTSSASWPGGRYRNGEHAGYRRVRKNLVPEQRSRQAGAAYFDPASRSFNGPFNSTGLVHPQQVAIDANGFAWYNDSAGTTLPGYMVSAPLTTQSASLPATVSNALTVGGDNRVNVGVTNGATFAMANISADRSTYSLDPGITFTLPVTSIAVDIADGDAVTIEDPLNTRMQSYFVTAAPAKADDVDANDDSGQVIYTGNDNIAVRSYSGSGNNKDALCIYSQGRCFNLQGATRNTGEGLAIDGGKNLWVAESSDQAVIQVPVNNPNATGGAIYLNSNGNNNIPNNEFLHGTGNGATATAPYGIGIDATGNVWVTNASCITDLHSRQLYADGDCGRRVPDDHTGFGTGYKRQPRGTEPTH